MASANQRTRFRPSFAFAFLMKLRWTHIWFSDTVGKLYFLPLKRNRTSRRSGDLWKQLGASLDAESFRVWSAQNRSDNWVVKVCIFVCGKRNIWHFVKDNCVSIGNHALTLEWRHCTHSHILLYGELGRYPLYINRHVSILKYVFKLLHTDNIILQHGY